MRQEATPEGMYIIEEDKEENEMDEEDKEEEALIKDMLAMTYQQTLNRQSKDVNKKSFVNRLSGLFSSTNNPSMVE